MNVAIVGCREFSDYDKFCNVVNKILSLDEYQETSDFRIISGGARGTDTMAEEYAEKSLMSKEIIRPDNEKYGFKYAPIVRNTEIARKCDIMISFWDGKGNGTKDVTLKGICHNKTTYIYFFKHDRCMVVDGCHDIDL